MFVMSKCKIRQQAQLSGAQGTQSQLLNRAQLFCTGADSALCLCSVAVLKRDGRFLNESEGLFSVSGVLVDHTVDPGMLSRP